MVQARMRTPDLVTARRVLYRLSHLTPKPPKETRLPVGGNKNSGILNQKLILYYHLCVLYFKFLTCQIFRLLKNVPRSLSFLPLSKCLRVCQSKQHRSLKWVRRTACERLCTLRIKLYIILVGSRCFTYCILEHFYRFYLFFFFNLFENFKKSI